MIHQFTDTIWVGNSHDEGLLLSLNEVEEWRGRVGSMLCVAHDWQARAGWDAGVEHAQVGLVDGPGNVPATYAAAVLALHGLQRRHRATLVYCHTGGRATAVVVMYLAALAGHGWPGDWVPSWGAWVARLGRDAGADLPAVHEAHREAFRDMHRLTLVELLGDV